MLQYQVLAKQVVSPTRYSHVILEMPNLLDLSPPPDLLYTPQCTLGKSSPLHCLLLQQLLVD